MTTSSSALCLKVEKARRKGNLSANLQHETLTVQHEISQSKRQKKKKNNCSVRKPMTMYEQARKRRVIIKMWLLDIWEAQKMEIARRKSQFSPACPLPKTENYQDDEEGYSCRETYGRVEDFNSSP